MVEQIESSEELERLRAECDRLRKERDNYRRELEGKHSEFESSMSERLKNYCNTLKGKVLEDYEKRIRRGTWLLGLLVSILGITGFYSVRSMIEYQVEKKIESEVRREVKDKSELIDTLTSKLFDSITKSQQDIEKQLVRLGVNIDRIGRDALLFAIQEGDPGVVKMLLDAGANPNAVDIEQTPALHLATKRGQPEMVKSLLDSRAEVDRIDRDGRTALMHAAHEGFTQIAEALVDSKANVNRRSYWEYDKGATPLIIAAKQGKRETVKLLLERGAKLEVTNDDGITALSLAKKELELAEEELESAKEELKSAKEELKSAKEEDYKLKLARKEDYKKVVEILNRPVRSD